ncbi:exonuclease V a 5' deoxyribonuclease-domain-containing protein [Cantharellus anzutake]|uniref:exonuclease V a 5' deoxyribonuclease-domain-containing protein n=1 Tax=Cantharellus anzutake TaxID=1750568 RepID=UPI001902D4D0|nr:exonuclease V a 5' deoxyribonuclease-domain-containing protein [Cantharellus anzutake]KAF8340467.1 exonuclease V a 5' deoxyribonuclease-domain-containing protein [Cantharellus anzutake]
MAVEDDEFADLEDIQFSREELQAIEAIEGRASDASVTCCTAPAVSPAFEPATSCKGEASVPPPAALGPSLSHDSSGASTEVVKMRRLHLLNVFRPVGSLSVTDLVGPQWCELKFDYTLRWGNRWQRVINKPSHIITARGKRIEVEKTAAKQSEAIMDSGRSIHKKLERAIQPEEIVVPVITGEERVASKLLTMISCIQLLKTLGYCREFPVMGIIDDILIIGVIDEIVRKEVEQPKTKKERARYARQQAILRFLSPTKHTPSEENFTRTGALPGSSYILHLIDNKSRSLPHMPPERDRIQSRLQLMLYKRLLENLLEPKPFLQTLSKYSVNLRATFSPKFLQAQEVLCVSNSLSEVTREATCLEDLVVAFQDAVMQLHLVPRSERSSSPVENELELVYRSRGPDESSGPRKRARRHGKSRPIPLQQSGSSNGNLLEAKAREQLLVNDLGLRTSAPPSEYEGSSCSGISTPLSAIEELPSAGTETNPAVVFGAKITESTTNLGKDYFGSNAPLGDAPLELPTNV